jgi:hypothetical protein
MLEEGGTGRYREVKNVRGRKVEEVQGGKECYEVLQGGREC